MSKKEREKEREKETYILEGKEAKEVLELHTFCTDLVLELEDLGKQGIVLSQRIESKRELMWAKVKDLLPVDFCKTGEDLNMKIRKEDKEVHIVKFIGENNSERTEESEFYTKLFH